MGYPITFAKPQEVVEIVKVSGDEKVRQHLAELGFTVGTKVTVINQIQGNVILQVKESRIAINKDMANKIMV